MMVFTVLSSTVLSKCVCINRLQNYVYTGARSHCKFLYVLDYVAWFGGVVNTTFFFSVCVEVYGSWEG